MNYWVTELTVKTGFSPDVFEDILYVMEGKVLHILYRTIDRQSALKKFPKQLLIRWPAGDSTHRFECMCNRIVPVDKGIYTIRTVVSGYDICPCTKCLKNLPGHMCDKAVAEMVGAEVNDWVHADSLRFGRIKWRD